ncbi:MAG: hypothetical protein WC683_16130 [bacterium]
MNPTWSQGEEFIDGVPIGPIESVSFEADRFNDIAETQTIEGTLRIPMSFHTVITFPVSKRAGRRLSRMFDTAAPLRQLRHVRRGCGPGGHRNSRLSRRLERVLFPIALAHMIAQQHAEREALRRWCLAAQARAMEAAVQRDIDARAAGGPAPTVQIETEGSGG